MYQLFQVFKVLSILFSQSLSHSCIELRILLVFHTCFLNALYVSGVHIGQMKCVMVG